MTKFGPYPEYKDSGVEWFPRLPVSWSATKLKHISECLPGGTPDTSIDDYWRTDGSGSPWVSIGDMSGRQIISTTAKSLTEEALASKPLPIGKPGTLLFAMYASVGEVTPLGIHASWNQALLGIEARSTADTRFLYYALQSIRDWLPALYRSNTQNNLNADQVGNFDIPLPPVEMQKSISAYLDRETAQIDGLIGKQERLIELMAEKRQAVITHAVTNGLDATAPTKPSGIPWLGDIPRHWTVPQLGMHAKVGNGSTPNRDTTEYWSGGDIPWLNSSHVNRDEITDADQFVSEVATAECHLPLVGAESLLIGLTGQGRTRGMTSILRFPATINQHVAYVMPETSVWNPVYLLWSLRASYDRLRELSDENGSTKGALTCTAIKKLKIASPPLSEQNAIAASIHEQLAGIDRIVAASTAVVELLGERRSALISAAVSGKIRIIEE